MTDRLYFTEISAIINHEPFEKLLSLITAEKQDKIDHFRFDIDKKLSVYSELFVRLLARQEIKINNRDIIFEKNEYGKPYIKGYPEFHFNISHTRNAMAIAVSDKPVGIDIERISQFDMKIAERFFTVHERRYITEVHCNQARYFYEIWTKKEAYSKWIGKGLSIPLNSFDVLSDELAAKIDSYETGEYVISACGDKEEYIHIAMTEKELNNRLHGLF